MRFSICLFFCLLLVSCQIPEKGKEIEGAGKKSTETEQTPIEEMPTIPIPEGMELLGEADGDLNKDGMPERVHVYDTGEEVEMGTKRMLYVYQATGDTWDIWHQSTGAVLPSQHGGMMGDPFEALRIERGSIVIDHFGGSREKWNYTHRFRFQKGRFELIGASVRFGAPCDYWDHFDYNLSTGRIDIKMETEDCDHEDNHKEKSFTFTEKKEKLPQMDGFYPGNNEVAHSESGASFYY